MAVKYGLLVLYGLLAAVAVVAVLYFFYPPVHSLIAGAWAWIAGGLGNISIGGFDLSGLIKDNIGAIAGLGVGAITALISYVKLRSQISQNQDLLKSQEELVAKNLNLTGETETLKKTVTGQAETIQMYADDTTATQLQGRISEIQQELSLKTDGYERIINDQKKQIRELQDKIENRPVVEVPTYK